MMRNGTKSPAPSLPLAASPQRNLFAPWQQDRAFRALLAVFALNGIASAVPATLVLFFVGDVLRLPQHEGTFLAAYFVCGALGMPVWVRLAGRFGAANAWGGAMWLAVAVFAWAALLGVGDFVPFLIICALSGLALGADLALAPALLAGVIAQAGASGREGPYFGLWNFVTKANLALAAGLSLPLLAWAGYVPSTNGAPLASTPLALIAAYCALPCVLKLTAIVLLRRHAAPLLPSPTLPYA